MTAVLAGGCMSAQLYDGPKRDRDEVARITGDPVVTAGSPVTVVLRQVDGQDIGLTQTSVDLLEGKHNLLVDCRIAETKAVSRHSLEVEVYGGRKYRLRAETGPALRECTGVTLEARD
jgi:CRISPR/Cas system-associated exonuclease Cas4 (RecB family)